MFIFQRPVQAVAAGLGVALLVVGLDSLCCPPDTEAPRELSQLQPTRACAPPGACGIVRAGS
jgi:hypothetical protein